MVIVRKSSKRSSKVFVLPRTDLKEDKEKETTFWVFFTFFHLLWHFSPPSHIPSKSGCHSDIQVHGVYWPSWLARHCDKGWAGEHALVGSAVTDRWSHLEKKNVCVCVFVLASRVCFGQGYLNRCVHVTRGCHRTECSHDSKIFIITFVT